jgi:hypothetical protein
LQWLPVFKNGLKAIFVYHFSYFSNISLVRDFKLNWRRIWITVSANIGSGTSRKPGGSEVDEPVPKGGCFPSGHGNSEPGEEKPPGQHGLHKLFI